MKADFSFFLLSLLCASIRADDDHHLRASRRLQIFDGDCTAVIKDVMYADDDPYKPSQTRYLQCMTPEGAFYDVPSASEEFIEDHFVKGTLVSGETRLDLAPGTMLDMASYELLIPAESIHLSPIDMDENRRNRRRKLSSTGAKSVLIVKVIASNNQNSFLESQLSDSVLGTSGDPVNMASQFSDCSHGKLTFQATNDRIGSSVNISNGAVSITVTTSTSQGDSIMVSTVGTEISNQFGTSASSLADHVLYCLPPNTMNGIAYAYINSWLSVYSNDWCTYMSVLLHEVGHNLGLGHSGVGNDEYGDTSGMMGYSYSQDDTPRMCFNAAKMWQLGWFSRTLELDASGTREYSGGIADMTQDPDSAGSPIVVKLNTPASTDYFLSFNRLNSFNSGSLQGGNQVRIVKTSGGSGTSYSATTLQSSLASGQSWTSSSDFSGESVTVTVNSIGTEANVDICIGTCNTPVTSPPTSGPLVTSPPTSGPLVTSPPTNTPVTSPPTIGPIDSPTSSPVDSPTSSPVDSPTSSPVDSPVSNPTSSPVDSPVSTPTSSPVDSPVSTPTSSPVDSPVSTPTSPPVDSPVSTPTNPPVDSPVSTPTSSPTPNNDDECLDSSIKFLVNKRLRNCGWVAKNNTTKRCGLGNDAVATHCPNTCNKCAQYACVDGTKRFRLDNGNLKSCSWVSNKNTAMRCNKRGVASTCRSTCSSTTCPGGL